MEAIHKAAGEEMAQKIGMGLMPWGDMDLASLFGKAPPSIYPSTTNTFTPGLPKWAQPLIQR